MLIKTPRNCYTLRGNVEGFCLMFFFSTLLFDFASFSYTFDMYEPKKSKSKPKKKKKEKKKKTEDKELTQLPLFFWS